MRSDVPLGGDIDGDGKADVADVALYATIIGVEDVQLRELARTVSAVRVDVTAVVRARKSSDGTALAPVRLVQTSWYAAGIGIVRRSQTAPATSGTGPVELDEALFSWDGVSEGLGSIGPTAARVPGAGLLLLPRVQAAAVVGNSALVVADSLDAADPSSLTLGVFDKRGTLQSVRRYPGLSVAPANTTPRLHGIDANTALLVMPVAGALFGSIDLRLQRFDAAGNLVGTAATINIGAFTDIVSAWDGAVLWLGWRASGGPDQRLLVVQPFASDGSALAAALPLDSAAPGALGSARMAAAGGRLLVTWAQFDFVSTAYRYAVIQGATGAVDVHTLGANPSSIGSAGRELIPVVGSGVAALQWNGRCFRRRAAGRSPRHACVASR